jgi:iron-sulfur cluster assembly protein
MSILITERAKSEINRIVEEQKNDNNNDKKQYLRVRVVGGGCSGFQYKLTMDEEINEKIDELYEINEVSVIVDKRSMMYINGATIDYLDDMNERGFKVVNPSAKSTCGCGSSFNL